MKYGETEAETLRLNGWGVGDVLEGMDGNRSSRILITAIGESHFLCKWDDGCSGTFEPEDGSTTLTCRDWKKVNTNGEMLDEALRIIRLNKGYN